jgi:hypothetical protein
MVRVRLEGSVLSASLIASAGCSNGKPGWAEATPHARIDVETVLSSHWGSGVSSLGHDTGSESMPDGPRSFVVDASHAVHVLDTLNDRVAVFSHGTLVRFVTLPQEEFTDFDVGSHGGYVLLDTQEREQVVFVTGRGVVISQVPLEGPGIDDPATVTAVSSESSGVWVELHHATWLLVASLSGQPLATRAKRLGKPVAKAGAMVQVALNPPTGVMLRQVDSHGQGPQTLIPTSGVTAITGVEQDPSGTTYVGLWSVTPRQETHELAVVSASGALVRTDPLPAPGSTQNTLRTVRMGKDGSLYLMRVAGDGVTVMRYLP